MARTPQQGQLGGIALLAAGFSLVAMTLGGFFLGYLVDRWVHISPWGSVVGLFLGLFLGIWDVYRIAVRVLASEPLPARKNVTENSSAIQEDREDNHEIDD